MGGSLVHLKHATHVTSPLQRVVGARLQFHANSFRLKPDHKGWGVVHSQDTITAAQKSRLAPLDMIIGGWPVVVTCESTLAAAHAVYTRVRHV